MRRQGYASLLREKEVTFIMTMPRYYEFNRAILDCLADGKAYSSKEIIDYVLSNLHLTQEDMTLVTRNGNIQYLASKTATTLNKRSFYMRHTHNIF